MVFRICFCLKLWEVSSGLESVRLLARQAENSPAGWVSFWKRSPFCSGFSTSVFRNVPGVIPEDVRFYGFKRNFSNLESAPKMRDSVLLNFWDSFIVTLPPISSETCAVWYSVIPRAAKFCDWLFLGYSCVPLAIAANSLLFHSVAINLKEGKISIVVKIEIIVIFWNNFWFQRKCRFSYWREIVSINDSQLSRTKLFNQTCTVLYKNIHDNSTFISLIYTFSQQNIVVYMPSQGTNREWYFNHTNYKDKRCRLWRESNTFRSISPLMGCVFSIFRRKKYELNSSEMDIKLFIPAPTQEIQIKTKKSKIFP